MKADQACALATQHRIPIGLHLNVTEGQPVSPVEMVPSLLSRGVFRGKFGFFEALEAEAIDLQEVVSVYVFTCNIE